MKTANDNEEGRIFVVEVFLSGQWLPRRLAYPSPSKGVREVLDKIDVLIEKVYVETGQYRVKPIIRWQAEKIRERIRQLWE